MTKLPGPIPHPRPESLSPKDYRPAPQAQIPEGPPSPRPHRSISQCHQLGQAPTATPATLTPHPRPEPSSPKDYRPAPQAQIPRAQRPSRRSPCVEADSPTHQCRQAQPPHPPQRPPRSSFLERRAPTVRPPDHHHRQGRRLGEPRDHGRAHVDPSSYCRAPTVTNAVLSPAAAAREDARWIPRPAPP